MSLFLEIVCQLHIIVEKIYPVLIPQSDREFRFKLPLHENGRSTGVSMTEVRPWGEVSSVTSLAFQAAK